MSIPVFLAVFSFGVFVTMFFLHQKRKVLEKNHHERIAIEREKVRKLQDSENRLHAIISHMNEAVVAVYPDFKIAYFNQAFLDIFSPKYAVKDGEFFTDVVRNTALNGLVQGSLKLKKTQKKVMEFSVNGFRRTNEVQAVYIPANGGEFVALVFYDLSEIKESERMKREFITNASHQLKTPLTAIQGYAETLIEDPAMDEKMRDDFLRKIEMKSIETAGLVSKLLKLSKLESSVEEIKPVEVNLQKMVHELEMKLEGILRKHDVQWISEFEDADLRIQTDPVLFELIVENLLENAVKYSKPRGKVHLSAGWGEDSIWLRIRDEGIGIPEQDLPRVFERFFRSQNAENHTHDGVGIGMAMVKTALEKICGRIEIISHQNEGTLMQLTFPKDLKE